MNSLDKTFEFATLDDIIALEAKGLSAIAEEVLRNRLLKCNEILRDFITVDEETLATLNRVRLLSLTSTPVIIKGESGTGKETIARALHNNRPGKFVAFNCTALPEQLVESILFGHTKSAFTGAEADKMGLFEYAQHGTLFIDEIGDMPLTIQAKLLRAIQEKTIRPLGSLMERSVKFIRIIAATHQDLPKLIEEGKFRLDLYWRLNTSEVSIKPLRERPADIEEIISHYDKSNAIDEAYGKFLSKLTLKGNVRELLGIIESKSLGRKLETLSKYL